MTRSLAAALVALVLVPALAPGQQQRSPLVAAAPQSQPAVQPQAPPGFQLNTAQQQYLDQVLDVWEKSSDQVKTFSCPFVRYAYDAFSPAATIASTIEEGEVSYQKPDKGSFKIAKIHRWQATPVEPGFKGPPQGKHVHDKDAVGEHWVCDGKSVFQYNTTDKTLVERPIPPEMQGKSIVDTPLPFLFGAEAAKLKARFFMKAFQALDANKQPIPDVIQISAVPKKMADAVEYQMVEIQLDRRTLMPQSMNIIRPDGSRSAYVFYKDKVSINNTLDRLKWTSLFATPSTPLGWKHVVDAPSTQSAAAPHNGATR